MLKKHTNQQNKKTNYMKKKHNSRNTQIGKYLSPIMIAYIAIIIATILETIMLAPQMTAISIIGMVVFDLITAGTSVYAIIIIYKRNMENAHSHQASGKSREALNITGWLLLSITMQTIIVILSNIN